MRQFSLTPVRKCTQTPSEIEYTRTIASVVIRAKAKTNKAFRCSATFKRIESFVLQEHIINGIYKTVWFGISSLCHQQNNWILMDVKNIIQHLNGTDSAELNQYSYNGFFTHFDRLTFKFKLKKNNRHSL